MKKIIALLCAAVFASTALIGCGNSGSAVTVNSMEDLKELNVGCQSGTTGETWALDNLTNSPKSYKSGIDAALELKNGKLDAVILDELPAKSIVAQNDDLKILDIKFTREEYAIAVAKGNTELLDSINKTIAAMKENGQYEELVNAFIPADGNISIPEKIAAGGDKSLKMGTNPAFPPFEYVEGSEIVGFDITLSQQIAADYGAALEVVNMEFDSLIAALQAGQIDMAVAGMSVNEERKKSVDFSEPYFESEQVIIVKK